jgi:Zn-dependent protease
MLCSAPFFGRSRNPPQLPKDIRMSLKLGRLFGINLYIHWSFWLLPLWIILTQPTEPEAGALVLRLALLGPLFGFVVLHEYGHALMARSFGIATRDVTLYPIGGVARLERMSEKPWEEFWIAIAGPLVNLAIAIPLGLGLLLTALLVPGVLEGTLGWILVLLLVMNVMLFALNLLPAFPMDGGRVLRSLLAVPLGRLQATRVAVGISAVMAVLFSLAGVLILHNPWLIAIAAFVILAGQQELRVLQRREHQEANAEPEPDPNEAGTDWHGTPRTTVTVYLWDPRKHAWIPQGVNPAGAAGRFR